MDWPARWHRLWHSLGGSQPDDRLLAELLARYAEPPRAYHTLQHLAECLSHFDGVCALAQRPSEVEVTLWFHDAIYETQPRDPGHDNEEASAQWAQQALLARGIAPAKACLSGRRFLALSFRVGQITNARTAPTVPLYPLTAPAARPETT